ncbi:hypothetical protein RUM44_007732, partial [Polyplax serrata]
MGMPPPLQTSLEYGGCLPCVRGAQRNRLQNKFGRPYDIGNIEGSKVSIKGRN